jgi:hypothetical protein
MDGVKRIIGGFMFVIACLVGLFIIFTDSGFFGFVTAIVFFLLPFFLMFAGKL